MNSKKNYSTWLWNIAVNIKFAPNGEIHCAIIRTLFNQYVAT